MIKCKVCGHTSLKFEAICPQCQSPLSLTRIEIEDCLDEARSSMKRRDYEYSLSIYKALADMGIIQAQREYAGILEKGAVVPRDLDKAMSYFYSGALKNDPTSAYRYSKLVSRTSDKASEFWLAYSALIGCAEAYLPAAEHYSELGDEETAGYYYSLAAHGDDTEAIVTMARRYYQGVGTDKNDAYAKWYMDKLTLPPLQALKLAYKLRSIRAEVPPEPSFTSRTRVLRSLIREAAKFSLSAAQLYMAELLAKSGTADSLYSLAVLYADGVGTEPRIDDAVRLFELSMDKGSAEAAKHLGDMFAAGKQVPRDVDRALTYYRRSAGLGEGGAYEIMGDMFAEGRMVDTNIAYAIELYERGAAEGDANCRSKAIRLREEREELYRRAKGEEKLDAESAFELCATSAAMGYIPAHKELARMFELGIGTEKNRNMAYRWYSLAVQHGDTDALYDLGRCYSRGIGTHFDFDRAVEILNKAKRYGSSAAEGELARLLNNKRRGMTRSLFSHGVRLIHKRCFEDAFELMTACASLGYAEGEYVLGCMYEFGIGTATNRQLAFNSYNSAFSKGFRDTRQTYKLKILKMAR